MGWKRYDIHKTTRCVSKLFEPRLGLHWRMQGHKVSLRQNNHEIWHSVVRGYHYDQLDQNTLAEVLHGYYSTPVEVLRARAFDFDQFLWWSHAHATHKRIERLISILYSADKRIGKNLQSIWLFTERDADARKLSYMRISNGEEA